MRGLETALAPGFSRLTPEFNDFLYAPIGEERNDTILTVLSALARLGVDPWQEASRLAQLSTEIATQRLTSIVSGLPNGRWASADAGAIAARLIALLPAKGAAPSPSRKSPLAKHPASSRIAMLLFIAVLGGLAFSAVSGRVRSTAVKADSAASDTASSPSAPLAGTK